MVSYFFMGGQDGQQQDETWIQNSSKITGQLLKKKQLQESEFNSFSLVVY